ncbi:chromosome condensation complex Condensin, subunit G [Rhizina undulata]
MPARLPAARSTRSTRRQGVAASSRQSTSTPPPPPTAPAEAQPYTPLQNAIATIFASAQKTTAGHRKLVVNMRSIFDQCHQGTGPLGSTLEGGGGQRGEKVFVKDFCRFLNRVLVVKKGEVVADRCLRFAEMFVRGALEKDLDKPKKSGIGTGDSDAEMVDEEEDAFVETPAHRFVLFLLHHFLPLLPSKEKTLRYRTSQFIALLLSNALPTFPIDYRPSAMGIFTKLRMELSNRIRDKEASVRTQAAIGLVKLLEMGVPGSDEEEDSDEEEGGNSLGGISRVLVEAMQNDPSADVRRTILYNLPPTPVTLPYLLERTRDVDPITRRSIFTRLLPTLGDFRHLSIGMREKLLRWGLNDRNESVRQATKKMFNFHWVEDAHGDLLEVLERLDVTGETTGLQSVKELALKGFWEERKDVLEQLVFDDDYWENLTAESAFLARSFCDYCRASPEAAQKGFDVDEKMPEVARLALHLQRYLNKLVTLLQSSDENENEEEEGAEVEADKDLQKREAEFIVEQLLTIALSTDYADEVGRRKMFALLRESLGIVELPEGVTSLVVECLGKLSMGEGDFCMLVLEVIAEVHDRIQEEDSADDVPEENDSFTTAKSDLSADTVVPRSKNSGAVAVASAPNKKRKIRKDADGDEDMMDIDEDEEDEEEEEEEEDEEEEERKAVRELMINLKCLHIAQCTLENVEGGLKQNTHLVSMLNGLIVPAVRSHEAPVRERGLRCLGLSCLLDRTLAEENLTLFAHCFTKGHETLQVEALHILSDVLMTHGAAIFDGEHCAVEQQSLYRMLGKGLKLDDAVEVQATAAEVICKLMLAQVIKDEELLKNLVTTYFSPSTTDNQTLRQILTYFLPVYCHSRLENQLRLTKIAVPTLRALILLHGELEGEEDMVSPAMMASQIADWTDPRKNFGAMGVVQNAEEAQSSMDGHVLLAKDLLERVGAGGCGKDEKKILIAMLSKLHIPATAPAETLRAVYELVADAIESKIATDAPSRNALNKLEVTLGKIVGSLENEDDENDDRTVVPLEEAEVGEETVVPAGAGEEAESEEEEE